MKKDRFFKTNLVFKIMITKYMLKYMKLLNRFLLPVILIVGLGSTGLTEEKNYNYQIHNLIYILECLISVIKNKELC